MIFRCLAITTKALKYGDVFIGNIDGRDKVLKVVQYLAKLYLAINKPKESRLKSAARLISFARRIYRIGRSFEETSEMLKSFLSIAPQTATIGEIESLLNISTASLFTFPEKREKIVDEVMELAGISNEWIDDVLTIEDVFSIKIFNDKTWWERLSTQLWLLTSINAMTKPRKTFKERLKLANDIGFCILDLYFSDHKHAALGQAMTGLVAALLAVMIKAQKLKFES